MNYYCINLLLKYQIGKMRAILLVLIFLINGFMGVVFAQNLKIGQLPNNQIRISEELSQGRMSAITEDRRGFMWFATMDGLNRYDGYNIKVFRHREGDSTSIDNNQVLKMIEDNDGYIWILTKTGINKFNPYEETFKNYQFPPAFNTSEYITDIVKDHNDNIWVSRSDGLFFLDRKTDILLHTPLDRAFFLINNLGIDSRNNLWIDTEDPYIRLLNVDTRLLVKLDLPMLKGEQFKGVAVDFVEDSHGTMWIIMLPNRGAGNYSTVFYFKKGAKELQTYNTFIMALDKLGMDRALSSITYVFTKGNDLWLISNIFGLFRVDLTDSQLYYYSDISKDYYLGALKYKCLYTDNNGLIWIGSNGHGVSIVPNEHRPFKLVNIEIFPDLKVESVRSFHEDAKYYWVGGYYGLARIEKSNFQIASPVNATIPYTLCDYPRDPSYLLIGSEGGGLQKIHKETGEIENLTEKIGLGGNFNQPWYWVYKLYPENDSIVWVGFQDGILRINFDNFHFKTYSKKDNGNWLKGNVLSFLKDFNGQMWAGTDQKGLCIYVDSIDAFIPYKHPFTDNFSFDNIRINSMTQTPDSVFWFASAVGLIRMDEKSVKLYTENDGLPNDFVYAVLYDDQNRLWMSTNNGLCSFHIKTEEINSYNVTDGLQNKEFNTSAYYKSKSGELFFGGIHGFNSFYPKDIVNYFSNVKIGITNITVNNEKLAITRKMIDQQRIIIPRNTKYFNIEFTGFNYLYSAGNKYRYRICEIHKDWVNLGYRHDISFHGLYPGTYHLEILASDNHGVWNDQPYKFQIIVDGNFWETKQFIWLMAIISILVLTIFFYMLYKSENSKKKHVEKQVKKRTQELFFTNKELEKANQTKDKFLAIISHDIKNPLSASRSVVKELLENYEDYNTEDLSVLLGIVDHSMDELTKLLENLLTWSRIQQGEMKPDAVDFNLRQTVENNLQLYTSQFLEKDIDIKIDIDEKINLHGDLKMFDAIIRNLLSNALKYSHSGGQIKVTADAIGTHAEIHITDFGVGMSEKVLNSLFVPGQTQSTPGTNAERGTGFGLLLIFDFLRLNNGTIKVESQLNQGTTFRINWPLA